MTTARAAVLPALGIILLLAGCGPTPSPGSSPDPRPTGSSTAEPVDGGDETDEPEDEADPEYTDPEPEPGLSSADRQNVQDAITSGNTAAIEGYLSDPVNLIIMASECCWDITPAQAVAELGYVTSAPGPWNFSLPAATVDGWRTNVYYGSQFTGDDITGRASDGTIVSFGIEGGQITKILMGFEEGFSH